MSDEKTSKDVDGRPYCKFVEMKTIYYYELIKCENGKEEEDALANCLIINDLLSEESKTEVELK